MIDDKCGLRAYFQQNFKVCSVSDPSTTWEFILSKCVLLSNCSARFRKQSFIEAIIIVFPAIKYDKISVQLIVCINLSTFIPSSFPSLSRWKISI